MSRRSETIRDRRQEIYDGQAGRCYSCGAPLDFCGFELAHVIPDRRWCRRHFGTAVIDHALNVVATHPGRCNSRAQLQPDSILAENYAQQIRHAIRVVP